MDLTNRHAADSKTTTPTFHHVNPVLTEAAASSRITAQLKILKSSLRQFAFCRWSAPRHVRSPGFQETNSVGHAFLAFSSEPDWLLRMNVPAGLSSSWKLLRPAILLLMAWVLLFELFRGILIACTWSLRSNATALLLAEAALRGLRFDLSAAAKVSAVFGLWLLLRPNPTRVERRFVFSLFALSGLICIFALVAEIEFYKEFQMRLNRVAFEFFSAKQEHNAIIFAMIWKGYPVARWMLVCVVAWAGLLWAAHRLFRARSVEFGWPARAAAGAVWIALNVVAFRGGWQATPLRWGDAVFSQNAYANSMTENGVFALIDTVRQLGKSSKTTASWRRALPRETAIAIVREATLLPGEQLTAPEKYPLLRSSPPAKIAAVRPRNVVIVMMESFTARFCGAAGAGFGATPNFDRLAANGIFFDRAFSVGTHTAQGVFGTLCSFPSLPDFETLMKQTLGRQPFRSLPAILSEAGFKTLFLYNGLFSWDNKEGFFRNQGVERFIGRHDYRNPTFVDPAWGVCDHDVFNRALEEFDAFAAAGEPFLGMVLTLSNHAPFNLPSVPGLPPITSGGDQNQRLNGVHYADWALGQFMDAARQRAWFPDTLFVFVGDHGFGLPPQLTEINLLHMHVPLLFYGPAILPQHETRHVVASQLDILPSVVGLLGIPAPHQAFGRDLFSLPATDPGHALVKRSGSSTPGWIEGNFILIAAPHQPPALHTFDLAFPPAASPNLAHAEPARAADMEKRLKAFVGAGYLILEEHLAAPPALR